MDYGKQKEAFVETVKFNSFCTAQAPAFFVCVWLLPCLISVAG